MEWMLALLLGTAIVLLIVSFVKEDKGSKIEDQIEHLSISFMQELHQVKNQLRDIELDAEIAAKDAQQQNRSNSHQQLLREILDLHKRGYSVEGIALETSLEPHEVDRLLSPYLDGQVEERTKVANDA
ncbi:MULTISPECIES: hypothetical protein [Shouchella]|uniref:Uncharacterized protein n=5 Tax=Bacillaceae TaxID=186817 RepID=A0A060M216_9BACI|nr:MULTISPECIES: hypothetical protein [Bacillaceae]RQW20019.1 hypothetical protein EH196_07725 [Bacillus sp. C1-1]GAF24040.1 hypothetical protein JCM19047_3902 [Bacillus sp. JCM 19047]AIC94104.1 hypothetical protein BleG1_1526 [Shouchella lehensis G1]KQL57972.1 hypothetical protein AN965_06525 [Alkalicoccobacillus plakortidis]MBG9785731.1 hypothetical protein [Shouchella lehensis]